MKLFVIKFSTALAFLVISIACFSNNNALRFRITGNGYSDETVIRLLNGATENFDGAYDAWKIFTPNPNAPSIYTQITQGQELSINTLPEYNYDKSITIFTNIPVTGTYTLNVEEIFQMSANYKISLTDIASGNHYYLSKDTILTLTLSAQQKTPCFRFNISTPITLLASPESCFATNDGSVSIENQGNTNWTYEIIDASGNSIASNSSTGITANFGNLTPGTYTAKVSSLGIIDEEVFTISAAQKIIADFELSNDTVYLSEGGSVNIINNSQNALSYIWDFGDGNTSSSVNPSYNYSTIGNYNITLEAYHNNCMEQSAKNIVVLSSPNLSTSIKNQHISNLKIKNLSSGNYQLIIPVVGLKTIVVYNLSGKLILTDSFTSSNYNLSLSNYTSGMYIVNVAGQNGYRVNEKIIR